MDVFNYCWVTLVTEAKKCNVLLDQNTCKVTNSTDECFDKPLLRVAYFYKFGTFNILFFQRCLTEFARNSPGALQVLDKMCSTKNLNVRSLSTGPGIDVIGFLYSLNQLGKPVREPIDLKLISKYGSWRKLINEMITSEIACLPTSTCKLLQCDILTTLSSKAQSYLKTADVVLMFQPFTSVKATKHIISQVMMSILLLLKPGALVFFISDKEKSAYFTELHTCGSLLYGPTCIHLENVPYNEKIVEVVGTEPICSGSAYFAVWQKSEVKVIEKSSTTKEICGNMHVDHNTTVGKGSVNSIASFSKSEFNKSIQIEPLQNEHSGKSPCGASNMNTNDLKCTKSMSQTSNTSINCNVECNLKVPNKKPQLLKQTETCDGAGNQDETKHLLNSLLKSFDGLVKTLENYVSVQDPVKYVQKNDQNCAGSFNREETCLDKTCCACSYTSCHHCICIKNSGVSFSHHIQNHLQCPYEYASCSVHCANYRCSRSSLQSKPYLVIPTEHLGNDALVHISSLANQTNKYTSDIR